MKTIITDLANWPLRQNLQPFLTSSHDALLYAQLIHKDAQRQTDLVSYREDTYRLLRAERARKKPNPQRMMDLAVKAQLFRESFMEAARINAEATELQRG